LHGTSLLLDLVGNDEMSLCRHLAVLASATAELERCGLGSGGSRLIRDSPAG